MVFQVNPKIPAYLNCLRETEHMLNWFASCRIQQLLNQRRAISVAPAGSLQGTLHQIPLRITSPRSSRERLFQATITLEPIQPDKHHHRQSEAEHYHSTARLQNKEKEQAELAQKARVCKETLRNQQRSPYFRKPNLRGPVHLNVVLNWKEKSKVEQFHEFEDFSDDAIQNRDIPSKEQAERDVDEVLSEVSLFLFFSCILSHPD
jgi:hypothetical protein